MKRKILVFLILCALLVPSFGANIKIPSIEMMTYIYGWNGELLTMTDTSMEIVVEGGYKFGGKIVMGFDGVISVPNIGQSLPPLTFKSVSVMARDILGTPLDFSYFVGVSDYVCYGDDFSRLFGSPFIQSNYRATYNIPNIAKMFFYKGIHQINGNGIKLEYFAPEQPFGFAWYLYQDHNFVVITPLYYIDPSTFLPTELVNANIFFYDTGIYSSDLRFLINTDVFKLEIWVGGTIDSQSWSGSVRGGALAFLGLGAFEMLIAAGMPRFDFVYFSGLDMFYFLFEARFNLGPVNITPTVFFRPFQYLQQDLLSERNKIDFNLNLGIFNPRRDFMSFGFEGNFSTADLLVGTPGYELKVLPYISLATPGVYWEIKVAVPLFNQNGFYAFDQILAGIQGLITIRAEF